MADNKQDICDRIREAAAARQLSQVELAEKAGLSTRTIYHVFNGTATLREKTVGKIAQALDIPVAYLLKGGSLKLVNECAAEYAAPRGNSAGSFSQCVDVIAERLGIPSGVLLEALFDLQRDILERKGE